MVPPVSSSPVGTPVRLIAFGLVCAVLVAGIYLFPGSALSRTRDLNKPSFVADLPAYRFDADNEEGLSPLPERLRPAMTPGAMATRVERPAGSGNVVVARKTSLGLPYLLRVPASASASASPLPLVLFLHGAGESGIDPWGGLPGFNPYAGDWIAGAPQPVRTTPIGLALDAKASVDGLIIAAPVTASGWEGGRLHAQLLGLLDEIGASTPVDADRVTVTGLSMGGGGTFAFAAAHPGRFAAAAPVCGWAAADVGLRLKDTPLWVAHGSDDAVVPVMASIEAVKAIKDAGNARADLHVFRARPPDGAPDMTGHDSWSQTYGDPAFWAWLRAQSRSNATGGGAPKA